MRQVASANLWQRTRSAAAARRFGGSLVRNGVMVKSSRGPLATAIVIALAMVAIGMPVTSVAATTEFTGGITGVVQAADSGSALAGVHVEVRGSDKSDLPWQANATTAADGSYSVDLSGCFKAEFTDPSGAYARETIYGCVSDGDDDVLDVLLDPAGRISGTIVDSTTGLPIEGACSEVFASSDSTLEVAGEACTGSDGRYTVAGLPPGEYAIWFHDPSGRYQQQVFDNGTIETIDIDHGSNRTGIDAALTPRRPAGGRLDIAVIDADTQAAVTGCLVTISWQGSEEGPEDAETKACDESGRVVFDDPLPGPYAIYVEPFDPSFHEPYDASIEISNELEQVTVELLRTRTIRGSVLTPNGEPVPSVTVTACPYGLDPVDQQPCSEVIVDASGNYVLTQLAAGPYVVTFRSAGLAAGWSPDVIDYDDGVPVDVDDGLSPSGIDAVFTPIGGGITGLVTSEGSGSPLGRVVVRAYQPGATVPTAATVSTPDGRYRFSNLAVGSYHVQFDTVGFVTEWFDDSTTTPTPVPVAGGATTTDIDAELEREGSITGIVTAELGGQGANSKEYCVTVALVADPSAARIDCATFGTRYRVGGLPAGEYSVSFTSDHYNTEWWDDASSPGDATAVVVAAGASATANAVLARRGALSGTITDHLTGAPIPNVLVSAFPLECDGLCPLTDVLTDASGRFLVVPVAGSGSYAIRAETVRAGTHRTGYFTAPGELVDPETVGPLVVGDTGVTTGIDFTLDPYPTISGQVTDASTGLPLKSVVVFLQNAESQLFEGSARTNASGEYRLPAPEGEYWVVFTRSGYRPVAHSDVAGADCLSDDPTPCTSLDTTDGSSHTGIDAALTRATHALSASTMGTGTGAVVSRRAGLDCGALCTVDVEDDRWIALTAVPAASSDFAGWSGACTGTGVCVVPMTQARSVTASFVLKTYTLAVSRAGTGAGSVDSSSAGVACGSTCAVSFDHGSSVTLTATPSAGSVFAGWSGACSGTGVCTVSMTQARTVTASFTRVTVPPSAPSGVAWLPGDGAVVMSWNVPSRPGDAPMTGFEYSLDSGAWVAFGGSSGASTSGSIPGLVNGRSYRVRVRAVSAAGGGAPSSSVTVIPSTVPGAPSGLSVTPENRSLAVLFTAPSNGGASISRYEYSLDGGATWVRRTSTATSFTVSSLTNGTSYRVAVRAVNARGTGGASAVVEVAPRTVPGVPTGVVVTPADRQLTVAWVGPASDGGSPLTGFQVSIDGGRTWMTVGAEVRSQMFAGLVNGRSYSVRVRALNAAGAGSSTSSVTGVPALAPSAPSGLVVTPGNRSLSVRFTAPSTGGSRITAYEYSLDSGATWTRRTSTSTSFTILNLTNGSEYSVAVRAINAVGAGASSTTVTASPRTTPGVPTAVVVTPGNRSLTVSWAAPADDGGSSITSFQVSIDGGSRWTTTPADSTTYTVSGLTNGRTYRVRVRAVNAAGAGSSTSSVSVVPRA
jgi:5-hydroxyisourate hydrolase-like protein (transthyretin family)